MTTGDVAGAELNDQAQEVWGIVGHAVQDGEPGLPARTYQALQTWPDQHVPDELWTEILTFLPLEDQTRLARTSHHTEGILERLAPQALDPTAHTTTGFIRTIYTQTELNTSLSTGKWVEFIPGTDSDLTIGRGLAQVHGPGTLTAVTDEGFVSAHGDIHITTVTDGTVHARSQATITTVTDGNVYAYDQVTITTVAGGTVRAYAQASIEEVTGGNVYALEQAIVTTVTGGNVHADGKATVTTVTGGNVHADDNATVTAVGGDAHIVARGNAQVIIEAGADGVCVDAYDAAHITADSGTVTIHSPDVTITITSSSDGDAVINHA
ncbi:F-box protein [Streptomyces sp. NPDC057910]|uniref:F-box protein n=1 Tax=Streptomyces sp. NPDC057910 TaxID=3346278 RepID=UPI0036F1880A